MNIKLPKLWTIERYENFSAPVGSTDADRWWLRQFRLLLARERAGMSPSQLQAQWLVLGRYVGGKSRRQLTFGVPDFITHILDDADVRSKDGRYADGQWQTGEKWLNG